MGAINTLGLANGPSQKYFRHQPAKFMAIPLFILNLRITGET